MAMALPTRRGDRRALAVALLVGAAHAAGVAALVASLDYPVDSLAGAPGGTAGALLGLAALLGVPTFLLVRYRLAVPLGVAAVGAGWPVYRELTTPAPEFSTLGGYTVVHGTRYLDGYVDAWYVWLFAYLLVGLAEHVVRTDLDRLPDPVRDGRLDRLFRGDARSARRMALAVGAGHAAVFLWLAADWGYFAPNGYLPSPWYAGLAVLAWTVLGLALVGGVPAFLLVRVRLVLPTVGLAWLVRQTGWTQTLPLPDDSLPIYFLGWFFFAGLLLAAAGVEYGLRAAWKRADGGTAIR